MNRRRPAGKGLPGAAAQGGLPPGEPHRFHRLQNLPLYRGGPVLRGKTGGRHGRRGHHRPGGTTDGTQKSGVRAGLCLTPQMTPLRRSGEREIGGGGRRCPPILPQQLLSDGRGGLQKFLNHHPHQAQHRIQLPEAVQLRGHGERHLGRELVISLPENYFHGQPRKDPEG